jgi:hypothetical protein
VVPDNQLGLGLLLVLVGVALGLAAWVGRAPDKVTIIGIEFGGSGAGLSRNARLALAVVAVTLGIAGFALTVAGFVGPGPTPSPTPTPAATAPPTTPAASPSPVATTVVPDVIGLPPDVAEGDLDNLRLVAEVQCEQSDTEEQPGLVYATDPRDGTIVPEWSTVVLLVQPPCP